MNQYSDNSQKKWKYVLETWNLLFCELIRLHTFSRRSIRCAQKQFGVISWSLKTRHAIYTNDNEWNHKTFLLWHTNLDGQHTSLLLFHSLHLFVIVLFSFSSLYFIKHFVERLSKYYFENFLNPTKNEAKIYTIIFFIFYHFRTNSQLQLTLWLFQPTTDWRSGEPFSVKVLWLPPRTPEPPTPTPKSETFL